MNEPKPVNCWDIINRIVVGAGLPPVTRRIQAAPAYALGRLCEKWSGLIGRKEDPRLTRFLVTQLATDHWFRMDKARRDLGWRPRAALANGIERMLRDMRERDNCMVA